MRVVPRLVVAVIATVLVATMAPSPASAQEAPPVPPGWQLVAEGAISEGVRHLRVRRPAGPVVADIVRIAPESAYRLRTVVSNEQISGPPPRRERTSSMCQRVGCVAAVNGDFAVLGADHPIGGAISGGRLLRSVNPWHHQLVIGPEGQLSAGTFTWAAQLMPSDLKPIGIGGVNTNRGPDGLILYTPAWGPSTEANSHGAELVLKIIEPAGPIRIRQTALAELVELRDGVGNAPIPLDGAVLSGHGTGAATLRDLWHKMQTNQVARRALIRVEVAGDPSESLGGTPVLLRDGKRWVHNDGSGFIGGRHPRTMVGWNRAGEVVLVTVDGRQPGHSVGVSLLEAADLLAALGMTDGMNLDGGGSTTLVVGGSVANRPSDVLVRRRGEQRVVHSPRRGDEVVGHVERPVTIALALVPENAGVVPASSRPLSSSPGLPLVEGIELAAAADAGSHPLSGLPALLPATATPPGSDGSPTPLVLLAAVLNFAVLAAGGRMLLRRSLP